MRPLLGALGGLTFAGLMAGVVFGLDRADAWLMRHLSPARHNQLAAGAFLITFAAAVAFGIVLFAWTP